MGQDFIYRHVSIPFHLSSSVASGSLNLFPQQPPSAKFRQYGFPPRLWQLLEINSREKDYNIIFRLLYHLLFRNNHAIVWKQNLTEHQKLEQRRNRRGNNHSVTTLSPYTKTSKNFTGDPNPKVTLKNASGSSFFCVPRKARNLQRDIFRGCSTSHYRAKEKETLDPNDPQGRKQINF